MDMNETVTRSELTHYYDKNGRRVKLGDWIRFLWWVPSCNGLQREKYIYGRILKRHGKLIFKYYDGSRYHERRLNALHFDSECDWEIMDEEWKLLNVFAIKYE